MSHIAVVADDLTGAADTGAMFAAAGLATLVVFRTGARFATDALLVSTHSRHLPAEEAAAQTRTAVSQVLDMGRPEWVYKKIDSTLRGHPGVELAALMEAAACERVLIAPAFPAQGRTTVNGRQLVDGRPLEETPFDGEVATSEVAAFFREVRPDWKIVDLELELVRAGADRIGQAMLAAGSGIFIADAETDGDLHCLVKAARATGIHLLCGSAGLARALQEVAAFEPTAERRDLPFMEAGPVLIVAGSQHPQTARQVELAAKQGVEVVRPDGTGVGDMQNGAVDAIVGHMRAGRHAVLSTVGMDLAPLDAQEIAAYLGRLVGQVLKQVVVGGLVLTGGDIAMAICTALESTALWLHGEIEPGIPYGRLAGGEYSGLPVVTKAGGFGTDQALIKAVRDLMERT